jgi:hypothetical protein
LLDELRALTELFLDSRVLNSVSFLEAKMNPEGSNAEESKTPRSPNIERSRSICDVSSSNTIFIAHE